MKRKTGSILLSCVMGAALLSGCTITIAPAEAGSTARSSETGSGAPSELPDTESTASPQETQSTEEPAASVESAQQSLSEDEEWTLFSQFWQEACIGNLVHDPCGEDFSQYQQTYWMLSSVYLENKSENAGNTPPRDANGVAYFPINDYVRTLQALFGDGPDYRSSLPDEPGPEEGTLLVCTGYDFGYVVANLEPDTFSLQDDTISVDATLLWQEPDYTQELGTVHYEFAVQPENPYGRYRFLSITGNDAASQLTTE